MGVLVWPSSIGGNQDVETCSLSSPPLFLNEEQANEIRYTYRVFWNVSPSHSYPISQNGNTTLYVGVKHTVGNTLG